MDVAGIGMWERDLRSDMVRICETMASLMGMPRHSCVLTPEEWQAKIVEDDIPVIEETVANASIAGQPFTAEFRVRREDGIVVWLQARGHVSTDDNGVPVRITGISLDVTDRKHAEQARRESESRFRQLADASPDGILVYADNRYVYANGAAARMVGMLSPQDLANYKPEDFIDSQSLRSVEESVKAQLEISTTATPITLTLRRLDGSSAIAEFTYGSVTWKGKRALQILCRDVTAQKATEEKVRLLNERLKLAVEGSGEAIWDLNLVTGTYELSGGMRKILGYPEFDGPHRNEEWRDITHPDDLLRLGEAHRACLEGRTPNFQCEYRICAKDGSWKWILSRGVIVSRDAEGKPTAMTGTSTDITAKKEAEELAWQHANFDALTGLPNRRHFLTELATELRKTHRTRNGTALLFIDLDGFKQINDLYGHEAGDRLLMEAASRIRKTIRETDGLARLGGDEFTVLLKDLRSPDHVEFVCHEILARLSQPFGVGNELAYVSASIGVALSPLDAESADDMLRKADTAMYAAKAAGKNQFSFFEQEMDDKAHRRLRMTADMRHALKSNQLALHFQPVVDLRDGHVIKTEALLRWRHPQFGDIEPTIFIPIAEEAGLMGEIGNWVFREATTYTKQWSERTGTPLKIALNKSPAQFNKRYLESDWLWFLEQLGLPPSSVVVEITEGLLLNASPQVNAKLQEYRNAGIEIAIDDFGTGYSSMSYLQKFDIDYLKIDQSFVHGIPANSNDCTITETMIYMAHKLGQKVIAEGIETKEQADFLISAGCDYGQGYYFAHPMPPDRVEKALCHCYR